ncbi:MAG: helix-turn-helix domain-containing protein [Deltaproteobacteria bacterium]|nr:helix-turn-helix domain-containing protein [Deltaproteobacteria bacterium]
MQIQKLLGARIKELRRAKKLTQDKLSELVNIEPNHLSRIEVGKSYPSLVTLEKMSGALNVQMKDFFEFEHHGKDKKELKRDIESILKNVDQEKLSTVLQVVKTLVR